MTTGPGGQTQLSDTALGIGYSVYFMLGLVFTLMGSIAWVVFRIVRREAARQEAKEKEKEESRR